MANFRVTVLILALAVLALTSCADIVTDNAGGTGGMGGTGAVGGMGGTGLCQSPEDCDDRNECTADSCDSDTMMCLNDPVPDGTGCDFGGEDGACTDGNCVECGVAPCAPDLIVTSLASTGAPTVVTNDNVELPIRVVVKNQGAAAAGIFKVSTRYTPGDFVVAFTVPGQSNMFYPFTSAELAPRAETVFEGKVTFLSSVRGATVSLRAVADSCDGDEFVPLYCRVEESDEMNNESEPISVVLP